MASGNGITDVAFKGGNVLPLESPSSLTGNTAKYESVGGKRRQKNETKKVKKAGQKGGSSALAYSELAQQNPLPSGGHKQAGGKRRLSSKKRGSRKGSKKNMKNMVSGFFKLFKK